MMAEGRTDRMCSECDSIHSPRASRRVSADAAIVARVLSDELKACKMRRAVCIKAKTTRNSWPGQKLRSLEEEGHTSLLLCNALLKTLRDCLRSIKRRAGTAKRRRAEGTIDSRVSSNNGVKSNLSDTVGPKDVVE
jgi:gluconate kinase